MNFNSEMLANRKNNSKGKTPNLIILKVFMLTILFSLFFIITFLPTAKADVISQNSGGGTEAVVVDPYFEGFFSGIDGEVVVVTPPVTPPGDTGGGGSGGAVTNISVNPNSLNVNLAINTTSERIIKVTNTGTTAVTISISQSNLGNHVILGNSNLTIPAGQTVDLKVIIVALSEPGIFTGTINIGGVQVSVSINVKTKSLLFDSNIVVLNKDYLVGQGDELETKVTLIPLGDPDRLDVTMFFTIRDYAGKTYLTKSETLLIDKFLELNRNFDTGTLPPGKYIIGLELRYIDQVAPSSAHFEIVEKKKASFLGKIILFLSLLILLILILIIIILIWRRIKERKEDNAENKNMTG